jgi:hypothetical protein
MRGKRLHGTSLSTSVRTINFERKLVVICTRDSIFYRFKSQGVRTGMYSSSFSRPGDALRFFVFSPAVSESLNLGFRNYFYSMEI